jgi:hypothetical protein
MHLFDEMIIVHYTDLEAAFWATQRNGVPAFARTTCREYPYPMHAVLGLGAPFAGAPFSRYADYAAGALISMQIASAAMPSSRPR